MYLLISWVQSTSAVILKPKKIKSVTVLFPHLFAIIKRLFSLSESESESHSVMSNSLQPHGLYSLWNSPDQNTGVGSLSLLQGIFPTQGLNPGLLHRRWILCQLSHKGSPVNEIFLSKIHVRDLEISTSFRNTSLRLANHEWPSFPPSGTSPPPSPLCLIHPSSSSYLVGVISCVF